MTQIISELNSIPDFNNVHEELIFIENETDEQIMEYSIDCFPDFSKRENESEEINEKSEMLIEEPKIEEIFSNKYTKESNNKSEKISQKKGNINEENNFWNYKSMIDIYKSENSNLNSILTDNIKNLINNNNNIKLKQNENSQHEDKINSIKENKKNKIFLISKNKNLFKIIDPNKFYIFSSGNKDRNIRNFINKILQKKKFIVLKNIGKIINIKIKKKRKYNADNIRKKIKARFLKYLKNAINERLKRAGSKYYFNFLPQNFVCNISKSKNRVVLNLTLEEVLSDNFCKKEIKESLSLEKYNYNQKVLDYLKDNQIISEMSNFNYFKDMKYYEIYNEYLRSYEFEIEINRLKNKENFEYIKFYIQLAFNLINFFLIE